MRKPAVSVIMPVLNRASFIGSAIASVQAQAEADWELVVADDGSSDGTCDLVADLAASDTRIRLTRNPGRRGPGAARNHAIRHARSDWLAFLDSDDLWSTGKLAAFMEASASRPAIVASDYCTVDHETGTRRTVRDYVLGEMVPWWSRDAVAAAAIPCGRIAATFEAIADPQVILAMTIGGGMWIHTSSVMVRTDCFHRAGGFDTSLPRVEDFDLWIKLAGTGPIAFIDAVLAIYDATGRDAGIGKRYETGQNHAPYVDAHCHLRLLRRLGERTDLSDACRALLRKRIGAQHRFCANRADSLWRKAWHSCASRVTTAKCLRTPQ